MPLEWTTCAVEGCKNPVTTRIATGPDRKDTLVWACDEHAENMKFMAYPFTQYPTPERNENQ